MENEQVIGGLTRKWADLAGEIAAHHKALKELQANLAAVEASIRLFEPAFDFTEARVSRKPGERAASHGEMSKAVYAALRDAEGWLLLRTVQEAVIARCGLNVRDKAHRAVVARRVAAALRYMRSRGTVESRFGEGLMREWRLAG